MLPVTLRHVGVLAGGKTASHAAEGKVSDLQLKTDADIIAWYQKVQRYGSYSVPRNVAAADFKLPLPPKLGKKVENGQESTMTARACKPAWCLC